ncbi:hypothetical protein Moror_3102 [Moniliophthora roreri MCA 2997]|uniref:PWI domain-containing protein n=1 Tax=Moniliophthora roreri (strain MCA 2997) TaxID=1381753 RepID=V2YAA3_MONRO|nr:hypothetical protein Moror_3102 [Moniliophthora roreri MCA 2997]
MADAGFFKGTSADQDRRFSDKELKLLKTMKFPPEFDKKVDMRKVNLNVIKPWITKKVVELVGFEDEVVVEYAMGLLEDKSQPTPDPKKMQINLTGFLTKDTPAFMSALWNLLLEAQNDVTGVPRTFVEEKKEELRKARERDTRAFDERDRRARLDDIRGNERGGRGGRGGRGRGRGRGGRGGYDDDRGGGRPRDGGWGDRGRRRMSRSPTPRRRSPTPPSSGISRSPPPRRYRSPPRRRSPSPGRGGPRNERSPPPRRRRSPSRSISRSPPPPSRRRPRSPSVTPPRDRRPRERDSRSPPARRRRISPSPSPARSMSRSPPGHGYGKRRRSISPPPKRRRRSPTRSRSPPRRRSPSISKQGGGRRYSRTPSARSRSSSPRSPAMDKRMDVDSRNDSNELKIKGQAAAEKKRNRWESEDDMKTEDRETLGPSQSELEKRENELKERALRNKVVRSRKSTAD